MFWAFLFAQRIFLFNLFTFHPLTHIRTTNISSCFFPLTFPPSLRFSLLLFCLPHSIQTNIKYSRVSRVESTHKSKFGWRTWVSFRFLRRTTFVRPCHQLESFHFDQQLSDEWSSFMWKLVNVKIRAILDTIELILGAFSSLSVYWVFN